MNNTLLFCIYSNTISHICTILFSDISVYKKKKEQKRVQAMINEMEVGDTVLTTGGFYGVLIDISDEDVIVEFGSNKNCRIPMQKAAIAQVEKASAE